MRLLVVCFFLCFNQLSISQVNSDLQLANYYFNNGEFDKAIGYYQKLYTKDPSKFNFSRYITCLSTLNENKTAERILKKEIDLHPYDYYYSFSLAQFYEKQNESGKANNLYEDLIDALEPDGSIIKDLFNEFMANSKNEYALKTLEKGSRLLKNDYQLSTQFAFYYYKIGQPEKMVKTYLDLIEYDNGFQLEIEDELTRLIDFSDSNDVLFDYFKKGLLEKIQKHPDEGAYYSLLVFLHTQKQEFNAALTYLIAYTKRNKKDGFHILNLGETCLENRNYDVAQQAFSFVLSLGEKSPYIAEAEAKLLHTRFLKITVGRSFTNEEIEQALASYRQIWNRTSNKRNILTVAMELAHIEAFYANQADSALERLHILMNQATSTDMQRAEIKMKIADIEVLKGDIWEASLLYMQIDKDFKFEAIGHEAKFKNAKIFYYDGEFDFAQSQLGVLKESTSKLIANDALQLSILITDNFGLDSNYEAMLWFAKADLLIEQHDYTTAFMYFDSILKSYPYHQLGDELLLRKARVMKEQGKWLEAISFLEELIKYHGKDILADDAIFQLADIYQYQLNDAEKAQEYLKKLLLDYRGSFYSTEARKRLRNYRGDKLDEGL